jgi:formylglycine-generating enzyme required for sulfatase activity
MNGQTNADAIQFSDPQFEAQLRSKVEKGWYWLPNYSGKDYIFKSGDFQSLSYLSLDSDYPAVSSLTDLQHFPMLNSIYIWDASKISDFSPIWNLKDQLEYLAINGSINADLSGVATMSKLRSIDLDGNQLKNLSLLGNYSQLQDLDLVGNHLDLSDSGIQATLSNFRSLIQTNRSNQGQWWYSEAVEVEPQMPKSFQNLSAEILRVQSGNDPQSNLLKGIHALLQIVESTEAHSLKEFAVAVGVDPSIRQLTLSDLPTLENYSHTLNRDLNSSKLAELFQNSIIPSLEQVDAHFAKIPSGSVIKLSQDLTGTEDEVTVDYADVLVLRSIVNLLSTLASMQSAYDWGANAGFLDDLDENPDPTIEITAESLRAHNSNFGGIRDAGQLVKAKDFLDKVIAYYGQASSLLRDSARLDNSRITGQAAPDRLFVLSSQDLFEEREFRDALDELSKAINGTYELKDDDWGLNKMLVSGGVPSSSKPFTIEAVNGSGNREIRIKLLSWYWGWGGSELIIRDATSKIVYNGTLSGASESSEIISLPANQSYTVEVLEGSNSWNSNSKFWEIHYYDSVVQSTDDDIIAESETIDLSQFFAGKLDLAALLPASKGNDFTTDIVTDPTMAGLFPQFTQVRVTNELTKAKLVPGEFEVSVTIVGAGHVTGDGVYPEGSYVGLLAKPYAGYAFTGWSGDASGGNNPLTLRAYGYTKKNLVANFAQVSTTSQWKWHGSFPWVYSHGENSWWYMKAGANGNFLAWKQKDKKWYSFDEASQTWIVISGQGSQDNKAGDTFTIPDLSLEMLWVAPGTFDMGSPTDEVGRKSTETQHRVTLTKGFYLGKYEVTQAQYEKVMTGNVDGLSATPSSFGGNPNRPVEQVSWSDVQVFLTRLNAQQSGKIPEGWAYVLPTEAQWEYACRAGTTTAYSWGNIISSFNTNFQYSGFGQTRDIGQYAANPWGFYDMHGNVWEWTADWFVSHSSDSVSDPQGSVSGSSRVRRGGSWHSVGSNLRSARRHKSLPSTPRDNLGFRLGFEMQ